MKKKKLTKKEKIRKYFGIYEKVRMKIFSLLVIVLFLFLILSFIYPSQQIGFSFQIILIIMLSGALMNTIVVKSNGNKMPVRIFPYEEQLILKNSPGEFHFWFLDKDRKKIKYEILCDRYVLVAPVNRTRKGKKRKIWLMKLSLGDVLIYTGILLLAYYSFFV